MTQNPIFIQSERVNDSNQIASLDRLKMLLDILKNVLISYMDIELDLQMLKEY